MPYRVRWIDSNGIEGEGTPWQDRELAQRYAEYASRLCRGRRRYWIEFGRATMGDLMSASPLDQRRVPGSIVAQESLFQGQPFQ